MTMTPWKKIDNLSLSFTRKILVHEPMNRFKISDIKKHSWNEKKFNQGGTFSLHNLSIFHIY